MLGQVEWQQGKGGPEPGVHHRSDPDSHRAAHRRGKARTHSAYEEYDPSDCRGCEPPRAQQLERGARTSSNEQAPRNKGRNREHGERSEE